MYYVIVDVLRAEVDGLLAQILSLLKHCEDVQLFSHNVVLLKTVTKKYNQLSKCVRKDLITVLQQKLEQLDVDTEVKVHIFCSITNYCICRY